MHSRKGGGFIQPSAPSLSDYYLSRSTPSTSSTSPGSGNSFSVYSEIDIPPPPRIPLPELPPPDYLPRDCSIAVGLIGDRAANFDVPLAKLKKYQFKPKKSFNPLLLTRRGCTDILCCFVFLIFLAAWVAVAIFGKHILMISRIGPIPMNSPYSIACRVHVGETGTFDSSDRFIRANMWQQSSGRLRPTVSILSKMKTKSVHSFSDKPYLLFFDLTKCVSYVTVLTGCPTRQVCVKSCPTNYYTYLQLQTASSQEITAAVQNKVYCDESIEKNTITTFAQLKNYVDTGWCTAYTVKSAAVLGRCMPEVFIDVENSIAELGKANGTLDSIISKVGNANGLVPSDSAVKNSTDVLNGVVNSRAVLQKVAADLSVSWYHILFLFLVAAVISFLWTVVMRLLGGLMIWFSIFLLLGLLGGGKHVPFHGVILEVYLVSGAGYCWYRYIQLNSIGAINDYSFQPVFSLYFEMPTTWMVIGILLSILLIVMVIIFLFVMSRIRLAVAVIQETSRCVRELSISQFCDIL